MSSTKVGAHLSEKIVTGVPVLGLPEAKNKLIEKVGKYSLGSTKEGSKISIWEFPYGNKKKGDFLVRLLLFEVSHKERYKKMRREVYKNARVGIAVFDFTNKKSLENLPNYIRELYNYTETVPSLALLGHSFNLIKEDPNEVSRHKLKKYKKKVKQEVGENKLLYKEVPSFHKDFTNLHQFLAEELIQEITFPSP